MKLYKRNGLKSWDIVDEILLIFIALLLFGIGALFCMWFYSCSAPEPDTTSDKSEHWQEIAEYYIYLSNQYKRQAEIYKNAFEASPNKAWILIDGNEVVILSEEEYRALYGD